MSLVTRWILRLALHQGNWLRCHGDVIALPVTRAVASVPPRNRFESGITDPCVSEGNHFGAKGSFCREISNTYDASGRWNKTYAW